MFRWLALCILLCAVTVGAVFGASQLIGKAPPPAAGGDPPPAQPKNANAPGEFGFNSSVDGGDRLILKHVAPADAVSALGNLTIQNGRVQPILRLEIASQRDGPVVFLATEVKPGETVPPDKKIVAKSWLVGILTAENVPPEEQVTVENPEHKGGVYRKWRPSDQLAPDRLQVGYVMKTYRALVEGDVVEKGQLLALIDTDLARDELASKIAKIDVAETELKTSAATKDEAKSRFSSMEQANARSPGTYALEEVRGARLTWERYQQEELAKKASLVSAQREANAALTILTKHEIRAPIAGEIKIIYKHADEAVKNLDPVLQLQSPLYLRVEALLNVQDLSKVKPGMTVTVEPTTATPPEQILSGHLQPVTCVAVSKAHPGEPGKEPWYTIVSGSEDRMVIGWDSRNGHQVWRLPHRSVIKSVACTGKDAERSLALIGAADGSAQIIDLDAVAETQEPMELEKRHQGPILCAAFSDDGKMCATSGDDRTIYLWDTANGKMLKEGTIRSAHRAAVTSLQFAPNHLLVSAGRDGELNVWSVKPGEPPRAVEGFDRRGGEVLQLGVSPDGKQVLYDQGKELLLLSLATRQPEGVLENYGVSGNFTHMALFAPNGETILTASAAESRLQLWRKPKDGRAGELRQFIWSSGLNTCGAFAPNSQFAVTGTQDHKVLMWKMPSEEEINDRVLGTVSLVDPSLNSGSTHQQVRIWVDVNVDPNKPRRLIPGSIATIVVPPAK